MTNSSQLQRLIEAGITGLTHLSPADLAAYVERLPDSPGAILVIHPTLIPARQLATLLRLNSKRGFVVTDMIDLEEFVPITNLKIPDLPLYLVHDVCRGDDMLNWSPNEALPEMIRRDRTPLTISEGICWLLQRPEMLEPNYCFMTIGSRKVKGKHLDARTPAIWISGGTGRDGASNNGVPKVGWCWADNRHTWLGFAHARTRTF
jgi:Family of unknown function (DUF5701)